MGGAGKQDEEPRRLRADRPVPGHARGRFGRRAGPVRIDELDRAGRPAPGGRRSRRHAAQEGQHRWQWAQDNLKRSLGNAQARPELVQWQRERAAIPLEQHVREAYAGHQSTYLGSAAANRGVLALTTRMPGIELANAVQAYIRNHGARRAQVDALIHPLFANGQPAAVQLLLSISRRFKQASVQATAGALVERLADQRGWTPDELADRTIPTAGFDADGLLRLDSGSRASSPAAPPRRHHRTGRTPRAPRSRRCRPPGRRRRRTRQGGQEAADHVAQGTQGGAGAADRAAVRGDVRGPYLDGVGWREFLLDHPVVGQFVGRLVWFADGDAGPRMFRPHRGRRPDRRRGRPRRPAGRRPGGTGPPGDRRRRGRRPPGPATWPTTRSPRCSTSSPTGCRRWTAPATR